jgi:hypothetical protein
MTGENSEAARRNHQSVGDARHNAYFCGDNYDSLLTVAQQSTSPAARRLDQEDVDVLLKVRDGPVLVVVDGWWPGTRLRRVGR